MQDKHQVAVIADDDEFFRMALSSILLKRLKFGRVIETASLDEALEKLAEEPAVQIALFDLAMPGMETPASLVAVRELFPDILVAVVSGSQRRSDILLSLEIGVHGYIPKALGVDQLASALQSILHGHIYVPASLASVSASADEQKPMEVSADVLRQLTPRQREILELLVQGQSNKEIARTLALGGGTVKIHVAALFRNLGVRNRTEAAAVGNRLLRQASSDRG